MIYIFIFNTNLVFRLEGIYLYTTYTTQYITGFTSSKRNILHIFIIYKLIIIIQQKLKKFL